MRAFPFLLNTDFALNCNYERVNNEKQLSVNQCKRSHRLPLDTHCQGIRCFAWHHVRLRQSVAGEYGELARLQQTEESPFRAGAT